MYFLPPDTGSIYLLCLNDAYAFLQQHTLNGTLYYRSKTYAGMLVRDQWFMVSGVIHASKDHYIYR